MIDAFIDPDDEFEDSYWVKNDDPELEPLEVEMLLREKAEYLYYNY